MGIELGVTAGSIDDPVSSSSFVLVGQDLQDLLLVFLMNFEFGYFSSSPLYALLSSRVLVYRAFVVNNSTQRCNNQSGSKETKSENTALTYMSLTGNCRALLLLVFLLL